MEERRQAEATAGAERRQLDDALGGALAGQDTSSSLDADIQSDRDAMPRRGDSRTEKALACLQDRVQLRNARLEQETFGSTVTFSGRNDLDWALSGIRVQLLVVTEGRAVAWEESTHAISIPGGIEPGEMRDVAFTARLPNATPNDAQALLTVLDVADPERRQLVKDVTVMGWSDERSDRVCGDEDAGVVKMPADPVIEEVAETVASCWNVGALSMEASGMEFDVGFELASDGKPLIDSTSLIEYRGGSEEAGLQGYEVARRAILMCGRNGVDVDYVGSVVLTFDGDGVRPARR